MYKVHLSLLKCIVLDYKVALHQKQQQEKQYMNSLWPSNKYKEGNLSNIYFMWNIAKVV